MNRKWLKRLLAAATLVLAALALMQFAGSLSAASTAEAEPDKMNLALRRTAHLLLSEAGDSTTRIPPVVHPALNVWEVRMEHSFSYDRLPSLLQSSLDLHGITGNYDVSVLSCSDNQLQLGYNFVDYKKSADVPCGGREMEEGCYMLQVTFNDRSPVKNAFPQPLFGLLSALAALTLFFVSRKKLPAHAETPAATEGDGWLNMGQSKLDVTNQILWCGGERRELTYRETKLLRLFASHPNQLLERNTILQQVWGEDGILVGRSVDMFVSRLRKLLQADSSLRIVAVHGVGYRLEINGQEK